MAAGQVKTEMQDEGPQNTTPAPEEPGNLKPSAEGGVTLALLSPTPASKAKSEVASSSMVKVRKRKGTILKIKVKDPGSQVVSDRTYQSLSFKKSKTALDGLDPSEVKSGAMVRAEEVQSNLEPTYPSFIKALVRSHVGSCFWMGLPGVFCRAHLPNGDTTVILEDEHGKQYEMKYIAHKTGLSAGWRQFSVGHNLLEGDVLVFQLVEPNKFKVYIIKAGDLSEVDGALGLLNLDAPTKKVEAEDGTNPEAPSRQTKRKRGSSLPLAIAQKRIKRSDQRKSTRNPECLAEQQSENDSEGVNSEVLEGFKLSLPDVEFKDVDTFSNFHIVIDGMVVNSELSEDILRKYYELCCSQNVFLHDNLIKGMNYKLIVGAICETINVADAVRACKLTTTREEFETWDKTLKAFKILGMNVGFLRARLKRLVELAFESEMATETRRYVESKIKRDCTDEEIRNLEMRILELKEENRRVGAEIECLKPNVESYELKFQEEVTAPW